MGKTSIEWTDHSVNPIRARLDGHVGHYCEKISPGCARCYASRTQARLRMPPFQEQQNNDVEHFLDATKLQEVVRRKTPTRYFWCDMNDMFGEWVPNVWIAACFGVMAATPQHTHQVLTKRAKRMREWFEWIASLKCDPWTECHAAALATEPGLDGPIHRKSGGAPGRPWPLPNVWLGVSAEDQQRADERIPHLLATPAAVRFVSAEPLLGPVVLERYLAPLSQQSCVECGAAERSGLTSDALNWTSRGDALCSECGAMLCAYGDDGIDWVIVGGESGSADAREMREAWALALRAECAEHNVAFFMKQMGARFARTAPGWPRDPKGSNWDYWNPLLRVRQMPAAGHAQRLEAYGSPTKSP